MILFTYGTRPEYLKVKPLIDEFKKQGLPYKVMCTGQHKDIIPKDENVINLNIGSHGKLSNNRLDDVIATLLQAMHEMFDKFDMYSKIYNLPKITHVLVQGDTTSVLGVALSSFHHKKKVIHLEAGLRTYDFDNPFPEEANRQLVSRITDIHLAPTKHSRDNLILEKIPEENIYIVGNTVLDNLIPYLNRCEYGDKVLVTLHRRENHDMMYKWFEEVEALAVKYPNLEFIAPLHPNPNVQKHKDVYKKVKVIEPLSHDDLLNILCESKLVITDSGGIQEECSFFKKICLVCRKETERPESVGLTSFLIQSPEYLSETFERFERDYIPQEHKCPYGDGDSSQVITSILKELVYERN